MAGFSDFFGVIGRGHNRVPSLFRRSTMKTLLLSALVLFSALATLQATAYVQQSSPGGPAASINQPKQPNQPLVDQKVVQWNCWFLCENGRSGTLGCVAPIEECQSIIISEICQTVGPHQILCPQMFPVG